MSSFYQQVLNGYFLLSRKHPPIVFDRFYSGHESNAEQIFLVQVVYDWCKSNLAHKIIYFSWKFPGYIAWRIGDERHPGSTWCCGSCDNFKGMRSKLHYNWFYESHLDISKNPLQGKFRWMKYWCIFYLITIILSFGIFIFLAMEWAAESKLMTYSYLFCFSLNICYRIIIFTLCYCYSQPRESGDFAFIAEYN